jgi:hypothetical protein
MCSSLSIVSASDNGISSASLLSSWWFLIGSFLSLTLQSMVSRPVCLGTKHLSRAYDQIFITVRQLLVCSGALSLTRGWVIYNCSWPLPAQTFLGPTPVWLMTIIYCLIFKTSLFIASHDVQGYGGGVQPRLHTGVVFFSLYLCITLGWIWWKTWPLPNNGCLLFIMYCCRFYLATYCLSKNCIFVETCLLGRCLAMEGSKIVNG